MKYKVHPRHANKPELITTVPDGKGGQKAVNLSGSSVVKTHKATAETSEWEEEIKEATQKDLAFVFKSGAKDSKGFPLIVEDDSTDFSTASTKSSTKKS